MFRPAAMVKLYCTFYTGYRERVLYKLQDMGVVQFFEVKDKTKLEHPVVDARRGLRELERTNRMLAAMPSRVIPILHKVFGPPAVFIRMVEEPSENLLDSIGGKLDAIEGEFLVVEKSGEKGAMRDFGEKYYHELLVFKEELQNLVERVRAQERFGQTAYTTVFGCWVPKKHLTKVKEALSEATGGSCLISVEAPAKGEEVPVLLENPGFLKPFELLTVNYGMPSYRSLDPTPILAVTFTIFFGIMFADVGYGLVLTLLCLFAYMKTTRANQAQRDINAILVFGGISGVLYGAYVGEIFGGLIHVETPWHGRELIENIGLLLGISVAIGIFHVSLSCVSRIISNTLSGKLPTYPLAILTILWSGVLMLLSTTGVAGGIITPAITKNIMYALAGGVFLLAIAKKHHDGGSVVMVMAMTGFEVLDELIALFANTISYVRIGILSTLHVILAGLVAGIILSLPANIIGVVAGAIIFTVGVIFLLSLGVFISFIHTLRLHWLEFFKRFYSGMGESFKTFSAKREVTLTL